MSFDFSYAATTQILASCLIQVSLPNLKWLEVPETTIDKLIASLITNTVDEFQPNGSLRQILRASIASLIMYDRDVVSDFKRANKNGVQFVHARLRQSFINTSTFDDRATVNLPTDTTDDAKAIATLNYWGEILRSKFRESNHDFQPLDGASNIERVISVLNKIGGTCADVARENRELRHEVTALTARVESDRMQFDDMKQQMASMAHTQMEMFKMLRRYTSLYNIPPSPQQHTPVSNPTTNPSPPTLVLASVPVVAAPTTAAQASATPCPAPPDNVEVAIKTAAECGISAGVKRNNPSSATSADENPTKQYKTSQIVNNFDHQRQHSGGTSIESIIVDAYYNRHFKPGGQWSFKTIKRDARFKDNAKFCRCLELFVVAATDEQKQQLEDANLDSTQLLKAAVDIAEGSMKKLLELEDKPKKGKETRGYTGVGARVTEVMTHKFKINTRLEKTTLAEAIAMAKKTSKITDFPQLPRRNTNPS